MSIMVRSRGAARINPKRAIRQDNGTVGGHMRDLSLFADAGEIPPCVGCSAVEVWLSVMQTWPIISGAPLLHGLASA